MEDKKSSVDATQEKKPLMFNFGMPESVRGFEMAHCVDEYGGIFYNEFEDYWVPPIDRKFLYKVSKTNVHHGPIIWSRVNLVSEQIEVGTAMTRETLNAKIYNHLLFGDSGLLKIRNRFGRWVNTMPLSSIWLRRRKDGFKYLQRNLKHIDYDAIDVLFQRQYCPYQQIYGVPDYLGGLQSAELNTEATLFRRKYYKNGAHCGFIFYATDPNLDPDKEEELSEAMANSKGVGNFSSLFVNIPNGKPDGIKIIPVGDIATKDDFSSIKNITGQDLLSAHRFPPSLGGIIAQGTSNLGDPEKHEASYIRREVRPLAREIVESFNRDPEIRAPMKLVLKDLDTAA